MYYISGGHPFQLITEGSPHKKPFFRFDATGNAELEDYQITKLQIAKLEQRGFKVGREKAVEVKPEIKVEVKTETIEPVTTTVVIKTETIEPVTTTVVIKTEKETDKLVTRKDAIEYMKAKGIKIPNVQKLNSEQLINELKKMEI